MKYTRQPFLILLALALLLSGLSSGCVSVEESLLTGNRRAYGYSLQEEINIGREADQQIIAEFGLYDNDQLSAYVSRVGQEVLQYSHARRPDAPVEWQNMEFTFRVLDSPVVNAFALPGGFIYVTRGLLVHLENEAQLAVVLGHEITHVVGRHSSVSAARATLGQMGVLAGVIGGAIAGVGDQALGTIVDAASTGMGLLFLRYGRDAERESDRFGVEYSAEGGYRVGDAAAFFNSLKRMSDMSGQSIPGFLSSHPDPGEREQTILAMANNLSGQYNLSRVNQTEFFQQIDNIVVGEDPRQGFVENNMFYHPELRFQYPIPHNWITQNSPSQVLMANSADNTEAMVVLKLADGSSAQQAATAFTQEEGMQILNNQYTRINGLDARQVDAQATSSDGQTYRIQTVFIEYNGLVYQFMGYTVLANFNKYASAFGQIMGGFSVLYDQEKINRPPSRLNISNAGRTAAFQSFVPTPLVNGLTAEGLAIINQVQLNQSISAGMPLKLVR